MNKNQKHSKAAVQAITDLVMHALSRDHRGAVKVAVTYTNGGRRHPPWCFEITADPEHFLLEIESILDGSVFTIFASYIDSRTTKQVTAGSVHFKIDQIRKRGIDQTKARMVEYEIDLFGNPTKASVITDLENRIHECGYPVRIAHIRGMDYEDDTPHSKPFSILFPWQIEWNYSTTWDHEARKYVPVKLQGAVISITSAALTHILSEMGEPDLSFSEVIPAKIVLPIVTRNREDNTFTPELSVVYPRPKGGQIHAQVTHRVERPRA